jgi:hypothetical protein
VWAEKLYLVVHPEDTLRAAVHFVEAIHSPCGTPHGEAPATGASALPWGGPPPGRIHDCLAGFFSVA